jgi:hypothetical protein
MTIITLTLHTQFSLFSIQSYIRWPIAHFRAIKKANIVQLQGECAIERSAAIGSDNE